MSEPGETAARQVAALREQLGARAAGLWRVEGNALVQMAFVPCADLPKDVAATFAQVTRRVALDQGNLGIVRAVVAGEPTVSRAADLPADSGSGRWLRAFGAMRSVAVPLVGGGGAVLGVISVALAGDEPPDGEVAATLGSLSPLKEILQDGSR